MFLSNFLCVVIINCYGLIHLTKGSFDIDPPMECQDFEPMAGRIVKRNGSSTIVSCPQLSRSWILNCFHGSWVGYVGSCLVSEASPRSDILYVHFLSCSIALVLTVALTCIILNLHSKNKLNFTWMSRFKRRQPNQRNAELQSRNRNPKVFKLPSPPERTRTLYSQESHHTYNRRPTLQIPKRCTPQYKHLIAANGTPHRMQPPLHPSQSLTCVIPPTLDRSLSIDASSYPQGAQSLGNFQHIYYAITEL